MDWFTYYVIIWYDQIMRQLSIDESSGYAWFVPGVNLVLVVNIDLWIFLMQHCISLSLPYLFIWALLGAWPRDVHCPSLARFAQPSPLVIGLAGQPHSSSCWCCWCDVCCFQVSMVPSIRYLLAISNWRTLSLKLVERCFVQGVFFLFAKGFVL
jgi:hypothetical protein